MARTFCFEDEDTLRQFHAHGVSRNEIAHQMEWSAGTITNHAQRIALRFDGEAVRAATDARQIDPKHRDQRIQGQLLDLAEQPIERTQSDYIVTAFDHVAIPVPKLMAQPPARETKELTLTASSALTTALKLAQVDTSDAQPENAQGLARTRRGGHDGRCPRAWGRRCRRVRPVAPSASWRASPPADPQHRGGQPEDQPLGGRGLVGQDHRLPLALADVRGERLHLRQAGPDRQDEERGIPQCPPAAQNQEILEGLALEVDYNPGAPTARIFGRLVQVIGANDVKSENKIRGMTCVDAYVDEATKRMLAIPRGRAKTTTSAGEFVSSLAPDSWPLYEPRQSTAARDLPWMAVLEAVDAAVL